MRNQANRGTYENSLIKGGFCLLLNSAPQHAAKAHTDRGIILNYEEVLRQYKQMPLDVIIENKNGTPLLFKEVSVEHVLWMQTSIKPNEKMYVSVKKDVLPSSSTVIDEKFEKLLGSREWKISKKYLEHFGLEYSIDDSGLIKIFSGDSNSVREYQNPQDFLNFFIEELTARIPNIRGRLRERYVQDLRTFNDTLCGCVFGRLFGTELWNKILMVLDDTIYPCALTENGEVVLKSFVYGTRVTTPISKFLEMFIDKVDASVRPTITYLIKHYKGLEAYKAVLPESIQEALDVIDKTLRSMNCFIEVDEKGQTVTKIDYLAELNAEEFKSFDFIKWLMWLIKETKDCHTSEANIVQECSKDLEILENFIKRIDTSVVPVKDESELIKGLEALRVASPHITNELYDVISKRLSGMSTYSKDTPDAMSIQEDLLNQILAMEVSWEELREWVELYTKECKDINSSEPTIVEDCEKDLCILSKCSSENGSIKEPSREEIPNKSKGLTKVIFKDLLEDARVGAVIDNYLPANYSVCRDEFNQLYKVSNIVDDVFLRTKPTTLVEIAADVYNLLEESKISAIAMNNLEAVEVLDNGMQVLKEYFS